MTAAEILLTLAALPVAVFAAYLLVLTLASHVSEPPTGRVPRLRVAVVIPAHNESAGIARTVTSLLAVDWPRDLFRVVVVADNCLDDTAGRAREAGAAVLERFDPERRGKGYALEFAFEKILAGGWAEAVAVVDADTLVSPNLICAFARRLEAGARAVQADYTVQNATDSWRTRLMTVALAMFHVLRSRGREALGLSCGLRGNGMCFDARVLHEVPHRAFSLVEDLEYGVRLGQAGHRVHYAGEAQVFGEMVSGERASRSQRRRWEGGRWKLAKQLGPGLLRRAISKRDAVLLDLALDVLAPPLSTLAIGVGLGLAGIAALALAGGPSAAPLLAWGSCALAIALYVARGWWLSGTGARGLLDLLASPLYIAWKLALALSGPAQKQGEWVRTTREGERR